MQNKNKKKISLAKCMFIIIVIMIISLLFFIYKLNIIERINKSNYPCEYGEYVEESAKKYSVDKYLMYAMMKQESNFNPKAVSIDNARGLMQLTNDTFEWVKMRLKDEVTVFEDMFDPQKNIEYAAYLISYLDNKFNDTKTIIVAYHAGMNITAKWLTDEKYSNDGVTLFKIPYKDTSYHVDKVYNYYTKYKKIYKITEE